MSYVPEAGNDFGAMQGGDYSNYGAPQNDEPLNLGPNIFLAKPGDLPPEAFKSATPTVQHLPDKIVKHTLPLNIKLKIFHQNMLKLELLQFSHQVMKLQI